MKTDISVVFRVRSHVIIVVHVRNKDTSVCQSDDTVEIYKIPCLSLVCIRKGIYMQYQLSRVKDLSLVLMSRVESQELFIFSLKNIIGYLIRWIILVLFLCD